MARNATLVNLLAEAGIIEAGGINKAAEIAKDFGRYPGNLLVETYCHNPYLLERALELSELVNLGKIELNSAAKTLKRMSRSYKTSSEKLPLDLAPLGKLLKLAGLISVKDLAAAIINAELLEMRLGQALTLSANSIKTEAIIKALELQYMVRNKKLSFSQAINQLSEFQTMKHCA